MHISRMLSKPPAFPPEVLSLVAFDAVFLFLLLFCQYVSLLYEPLHSSAKWQRIPPLPYMLCEQLAVFPLHGELALFPLLVTLPFSLCCVGPTEKQLMLLTFFTQLVVLLTSIVSSFTLHLFLTEESWSILLPCRREAILFSVFTVLFCNLFQLFYNPFGLFALCKVFKI